MATENYGIGTSDGLNEKRLLVSVPWLAGTDPFPVCLDGQNLNFRKGAPTKVLRVYNLEESVGEMSLCLEEVDSHSS